MNYTHLHGAFLGKFHCTQEPNGPGISRKGPGKVLEFSSAMLLGTLFTLHLVLGHFTIAGWTNMQTAQ